MLRKATSLALVLLAGTAFTGTPAEDAPPPGEADVVVVKMIEKSATSYAFEPASLQVEPGTLVRFVQEGAVPHNVEFKESPQGAELGEARMGPFLLQKGDTYEITIDGRFAAGDYRFVCTPHAAMGMVGELTVSKSAGR